jgi:Spy/CpxP family protein refolding chaperone
MRYAKWLLSLSMMGLMAAPVCAQNRRQPGEFPGRGGFGGFSGIAGLLQREEVRKELGLSEDQISKLKDVRDKVREVLKDDLEKLRDLGREERREKMAEFAAKSRTEWTKVLADVLKPDQQKRLLQIEIQHGGDNVFNLPEVEKALKLSDSQKDKMKAIREESRKEIQKLLEDRENFRQNREKIEEIRKTTRTNVENVLDEEQKKIFQDLQGEKFELSRMGRGRFNRDNDDVPRRPGRPRRIF